LVAPVDPGAAAADGAVVVGEVVVVVVVVPVVVVPVVAPGVEVCGGALTVAPVP
jgi:hypothetical protein